VAIDSDIEYTGASKTSQKKRKRSGNVEKKQTTTAQPRRKTRKHLDNEESFMENAMEIAESTITQTSKRLDEIRRSTITLKNTFEDLLKANASEMGTLTENLEEAMRLKELLSNWKAHNEKVSDE
jgi:hypothetical protein